MNRILEVLSKSVNKPENGFLIIGGFAVNAHGYQRLTFDLDILVRREQRDYWKQIMLQNGYEMLSGQDNFMQFVSTDKLEMPVDFMMVNETTFSKMFPEAITGEIQGIAVKHPKLMHLVSLKLHVLKQGLSHRYYRDLHDVIQLVKLNNVEVRSEEFKALSEKFGNQQVYEDIIRESR